MEKKEKINEIIEIEWNMFQDVQNIGGRASCQDDKETFVIMRTSQFENWTEALLDAYLSYIENAECEGRNLIAEKYGRMMKYTEPQYYEEQIKPYIPALSAHAEQMIEEVIAIIVPWEAEFAKHYPKLGRVSRPVTAEGDASGSIAGNRPSDEMLRERTVVASRCVNVVAGAGSVRSSAGT